MIYFVIFNKCTVDISINLTSMDNLFDSYDFIAMYSIENGVR